MHLVFYVETLAYYIAAIDKDICEANNELEAMVSRNDLYISFDISTSKILNCLHDVIIQSGNISKMFWPSSKKSIHIERANDLKRIFKVSENSVFKSREIRNAIEHFDERLDTFLANFPVGTIYPKYIGSYEKVKDDSYKFFRAYFLDTKKFRILDESINIGNIVNEINNLREVFHSEFDDQLNYKQVL